ncbi:MAG: 3'-5' exonuclease [Roseibium sp.]
MTTPKEVIVFDCEYMTADGAMGRLWTGPVDPDPIVVQIGAVKLSLEGDCQIVDTERIFIRPVDRLGQILELDPYFIDLTGISQAKMDAEGISLLAALQKFKSFAAGEPFWSWGKDELNLLAISCFIAGIPPTIPAHRFGNARSLLFRTGMSQEDIMATNSGQLAAYFGIAEPNKQHHDALDDAMSVAMVLRHFLQSGQLSAQDFDRSSRI